MYTFKGSLTFFEHWKLLAHCILSLQVSERFKKDTETEFTVLMASRWVSCAIVHCLAGAELSNGLQLCV